MLQSLLCLVLCASIVLGLLGCEAEQDEADEVLRVGVIASLTGPAKSWGEVTVRCAQVIADYHNSRGGVEIGGQKFQIELIIKDDAFDTMKAVNAARELSMAGVKYVIGPLGDEPAMAASRVLDEAGAFYVHYGFNQNAQITGSLGLVGMPLPEQSVPVLLRYLRDNQYIRTVLVMAYGNKESIRQKTIAESVIAEEGLHLVKLSRFDVMEESFDLIQKTKLVNRRVERIVEASPDVLLLTSCPPGSFLLLVDRLRAGGYEGYICAQNFQDYQLLAKLGDSSDGVYYVGGMPPEDLRSDYYFELKESYLNSANGWSEEAETKLYALEFILGCIREAGPLAVEDTSLMHSVLKDVRLKDPFYKEHRIIPVERDEDIGLPWQIGLPIRISKMVGGESVLVEEASKSFE